MRVAIDISPMSDANRVRGVGKYTKNLKKALESLVSEHEFIFTTNVEAVDADVVHRPYFDLFFPTLPNKDLDKTIVTVHDTIPLVFRDKYPSGVRGRLRFYGQLRNLRKVSRVITDSNNSQIDIEKYLKIQPSRIRRIYLSAGDEMVPVAFEVVNKILSKYRLPNEYALYVGDVNYNKNLPTLIEAVTKIAGLNLVIVSKALRDHNLHEAKNIRNLIKINKIVNRVFIISNVLDDNDGEMAALYSGASMYVQPSLYEGFGLPVLEAMKCGVPVVAANNSSLPEVGGQAAIYINPNDEDSLARGITRVLDLSLTERKQVILRGVTQANKFSWEGTARETLAVYEEVASEA